MAQSPPPEFRIVLIGNASVGKTCLHRRFFDNLSSLDVSTTYGADFYSRRMEVGGRKVKLGIWDTAGMERFHSITRPVYRNAQGVIIGTVYTQRSTMIIPIQMQLVYNITDRRSFDALPGWLAELNRHAPSKTPKIIVGNKLDKLSYDQEHSREVSTSDGKLFAATNGALFREASAKSLVGVTEVFEDLAKEMLGARVRTESAHIPRRQDEIIKLRANDEPDLPQRNTCNC
ncbi:ras-domain-containing protein [Pisolithus marmoratus]|nr:ras-domain-containing protein [Pisolithus marmoratus]